MERGNNRIYNRRKFLERNSELFRFRAHVVLSKMAEERPSTGYLPKWRY